jgi:hypothetical protein
MADFHVYRDRLEIRLTRAEKVLALRRDDILVPRDSIRSVAITADPWIWIRGVRAPGNSIPLTLAVGTWKFHGGKDFLVLKGKQRSAVVIDIEQPDAVVPAEPPDAVVPAEPPDAAAQSRGAEPVEAGSGEADEAESTATEMMATESIRTASPGTESSESESSETGSSGSGSSQTESSETESSETESSETDPGESDAAPAPEVAEGFSRVIVSTQHAAKLVEALREIRPGSDGPADEVIS